jgi:hypothetical protein
VILPATTAIASAAVAANPRKQAVTPLAMSGTSQFLRPVASPAQSMGEHSLHWGEMEARHRKFDGRERGRPG